MRNWTIIDQQAMNCGIAENRLRQYQPKHNHKTILYNTVARSGQIPAIIVKHRKISVKRKIPKPCLPVFSLEN